MAACYEENFRIPRSCILFFIFIAGSPQASVTSQVIEVQDGETVTTNCTVFGYPQAQVTWYINDTEVTELSPNFKAMFQANSYIYGLNPFYVPWLFTCQMICDYD